jgi:hypothetical protein
VRRGACRLLRKEMGRRLTQIDADEEGLNLVDRCFRSLSLSCQLLWAAHNCGLAHVDSFENKGINQEPVGVALVPTGRCTLVFPIV